LENAKGRDFETIGHLEKLAAAPRYANLVIEEGMSRFLLTPIQQ